MKTKLCGRVTDVARRLRTCPLCGYERSSYYCRHFVGILNPAKGIFKGVHTIVPDFMNMPVSDRVIVTTTGEDGDIDSYWMDYETGVDAPIEQKDLIKPHEREELRGMS